MNKKVIYLLCSALFLFIASATMIAQTQEQIDKFNEERQKYFTEKLELTTSESKAFWPLYNDFQNRKMKLVEDERNTWQYAQKNADNLSEKETLETLMKVYDLKEKQLALEKEYYQEIFLRALPAKKVVKLGKVEWDFRRYLLHKLREQRNEESSQGGKNRNKPDLPGSSAMAPHLW